MRLVPWIIGKAIGWWPWRGPRPVNEGLENRPLWGEPDPNNPHILNIPSDEELMQVAYIRRLARDIAGLQMPRRKLLDWVADEIYGFEGRYMTPDGRLLGDDDLADVDDVFVEDEGKWLQDFMKLAERPPRQAVQKKVLPRIRMLAMAQEAFRSRKH
ncbi:MAG: hypothetical protein R3E21_01095 [Caenibius sp.]